MLSATKTMTTRLQRQRELESILDVFSKFLPASSLGWHYRSQHHSLILYSNEFFYDRGLLIPPSTQLQAQDRSG